MILTELGALVKQAENIKSRVKRSKHKNLNFKIVCRMVVLMVVLKVMMRVVQG